MISKYIKLLFPKTSNYALVLDTFFIYLKVYVYHIMELFIYAFKFQFIVKFLICLCCSENKVIHLFINKNVLLTLIRWSRLMVRLVIDRHH